MSYIEVLSFNFSPEEEVDVKELLHSFRIIDTNENIANQAVENRKKMKIKVPDNIILSTAQTKSLILVTRNIDDFKSIGVELLNPFN